MFVIRQDCDCLQIMNLLQKLIFKLISCDIKKMTKISNILGSVNCLFDLLSYIHIQ